MLTFPEVLSEILKERQISASVAASALGYSSKTALLRILNGESKPSSYKKCLDAIKSSDKFLLTQEECAALERALEISTKGKKTVVINALLHNLLFPQPIDDGPSLQPIEGLRHISTMESLLTRISALNNINIYIFGKCPPSILCRLSRLTKTADVNAIHHIISVKANSPEDYQAVGETAGILFNPKYFLSTYYGEKEQTHNWSFLSSMIFFFGMSASCVRQTYMLSPLKDNRYYCIHESNDNLYNLMNRIIKDTRSFIHPLKSNPGYMNDPFPLNYEQFIDEYRRIEFNREIMTLKPDLPFYCIPPDILLPIILEGFSSICHIQPQDGVVARLYDIQKSRYENLFTKKKDSHFVLSYDAMVKFAITGKRQDHFFLVRPYTPQERVAILSALLDKMISAPHFHIWFKNNPDFILDKEITGYENYALALIDSETSWNISSNHQEILLQTRIIASCFSEYFHQQILAHNVHSKEKSIEIMKELIEIARSCEA